MEILELPQIVAGALVSGPNLDDVFNDARPNYQGTEVAIDYQTGLIVLLTSVLQLPDSFWHGGNRTALAESCHANYFRHYDWQ